MIGRIATVLRSQRGLTLLELIIVLTILGLIFVILGAALRISYNAIQTGDRTIERIHRARIITEQITQELRSAYRFSQPPTTEEFVVFRGGPERFSFVATTAMRTLGLMHSGLKEVTIGVEEDGAMGRRGLVLGEDVIPHGELFEEDKEYHRVVLDPSVVSMRCRYFGSPEGEGETPRPDQWEERWESDHPPKAVEVQFVFQEREEGTVVEVPPITLLLPVEQTLEMEK